MGSSAAVCASPKSSLSHGFVASKGMSLTKTNLTRSAEHVSSGAVKLSSPSSPSGALSKRSRVAWTTITFNVLLGDDEDEGTFVAEVIRQEHLDCPQQQRKDEVLQFQFLPATISRSASLTRLRVQSPRTSSSRPDEWVQRSLFWCNTYVEPRLVQFENKECVACSKETPSALCSSLQGSPALFSFSVGGSGCVSFGRWHAMRHPTEYDNVTAVTAAFEDRGFSLSPEKCGARAGHTAQGQHHAVGLQSARSTPNEPFTTVTRVLRSALDLPRCQN